MAEKQILAVDFGASGGRVMRGRYNGSTLSLETLHRFSNDPVVLGDRMYWDFLRLFYEVKQGLLKAKGSGRIDSIGIDTWGVDFGLLDQRGRLMSNPVHYRDSRTAGFLEKGFLRTEKDWLYQVTGNQFMEINTAFQLLSMAEKEPEALREAENLLLMPDLFQYFLSGIRCAERSIASTTQLFHMKNKSWAYEVMDRLGIPGGLFPSLCDSGTVTGELLPSIQKELGIPSMKVMAVAGHDTQSALAAVPADGEDFIFLSCGTWSLLGTELREPVITPDSRALNITNELGVGGRYSFLKNIIGLWLVQESRRQWIREGRKYDFGQLEQLGRQVRPLTCFINPDAPEFVPAGNMPERIRKFCKESGQPVPETEGEIVCSINQSLAMSYRRAMEEISRCTGKKYLKIYIVGGGAQSGLLCQMTANACNCRVIAGPAEATALGNAMVQYMGAGEFAGLEEARQCLAASVETAVYEPVNPGDWADAYGMYCEKVYPCGHPDNTCPSGRRTSWEKV